MPKQHLFLIFEKGDRVMAMWKEGRQAKYAGFYPSTVLGVNANGTYALKYDDGYSDKSVHPKFVRSVEDDKSQDLEERRSHLHIESQN